MAIITSTLIVQSLSLFHLTLSYYLLTDPTVLTKQNLVIILGAAMDLPITPLSLSVISAATALAAIFLALIAIVDITATGLPEEIGGVYWSAQTPIRLLFFFGLTALSYWGKFGLQSKNSAGITHKLSKGSGDLGWRELVCNSFVFSWAFVEMVVWFWTYTTLRDERRLFLTKVAMDRKAREES